MTRSIIAVVLLFVCVGLSTSAAQAQEAGRSLTNRLPFVRAGIFGGRTGTATGSSGYLEINPLRRLGFCAFVSQSRATSLRDGGIAQGWDLSAGGCATVHAPQVKGFLISPFVQMAYQNDHGRFTIPLGDGTFYTDGQNEINHLWTVGVTVDRAIVKDGPRWAARVGKNLGPGPAAENAGGLYLVGGVIFPLDHPVRLGQSFGHMIGFRPHANSAFAGHS